MSQAKYQADLSQADSDKDIQLFWASYDYFANKSVVEVVEKILEANQFTLNLENFLACLESLWFGQLVSLKSGRKQTHPPTAQGFMPCLSFYMPVKSRTGNLLKLFYEEMKKLKASADPSEKKEEKDPDKKTEELIREQTKTIDQLKKQLAWYSHQLDKSQSRAAGSAWEESDPGHGKLRAGTVHKTDEHQRHLTVKVSRQHFRVPLVSLSGVPEEGTPCIINPDTGGFAPELMFPGYQPEPVTWFEGTVTAIFKPDLYRIKCPGKGHWQIRPENPDEARILAPAVAGQKIALSFSGEILTGFRLLRSPDEVDSAIVQEQIARNQISAQAPDQPEEESTTSQTLRES